MRRGCLIAAVIIGVIVLVSIMAGLVADRRYEVLFASNRVPHEHLVSSDMGLRVSIQPANAGDYLYDLVKRSQQQNVPQWAFLRILPYEAAFILEPKDNVVQSTLYVNAQRLGPQVMSSIRDSNLMSRVTFIRWAAPQLEARERGVLVMQGTLPMNNAANAFAQSAWREFTPASVVEMEGNHFVELVLDNRAGSGYTTLAALLAANGVPEDQLGKDSLLATLMQTLSEGRITADVVQQNEVDLVVRLVYREEGLQEQSSTIKFVYDLGFGHISQYLAQTYGVEVEGSAGWDGTALVGRYRLKDLDRLLGI